MEKWRMGWEVGKIYSGREINKNGKHIYDACPTCEKPRMIRLSSKGRLCGSCATKKSHKNNPRIGRKEDHYNWKGGILKNGNGYILEYVTKHNPYYQMATFSKGKKSRFGAYCLQHRLVMAKHLKRTLEPNEIVHHINGDKTDNRIDNLKLTERRKHKVTYQDGYRDGYRDAMVEYQKKWDGEDWIGI